MRLSQTAINKIKSNNQVKARLISNFDKSPFTIERWISDNERNGQLTTASALQIISDETGLNDDQILEREPDEVRA